MAKQSIYLGWRNCRDFDTEEVIRQLVYVSSDYDTMVKTLEKEFNLDGAEFVELNENAELKSESFGYCGGLFIEEQVVDCYWNGYTPIVELKKMNGLL
jgi:hypothetical protein